MSDKVEISDAAVEAGTRAALKRNYGSLGDDMTESLMRDDVRVALEAAYPLLVAEPVPVADRERLARILDPDIFDETKKRSKMAVAQLQIAVRQHMAYEGADRLIAAGVFRSEAVVLDRAAARRAIYTALFGSAEGTYAHVEAALDAVTALARPEAVVKAEALREASRAFDAQYEYFETVSKQTVVKRLRERADDLEGKP